MRLAFALALLIVVLTAIFALQNAQDTRVAFFAWEYQGPQVLVLLVTFAAGILAGWLAALPSVWQRARTISQLRRELHQPPDRPGPQGP
jgi:uncharacterized integral membrane protein